MSSQLHIDLLPSSCGRAIGCVGQKRPKMLAALGWLLLGLSLLQSGPRVTAAAEQELFAEKFPTATLAKPWKTIGGKWQVQSGVLKQLDAGHDDPCKAVLLLGDAEELSAGVEVTAKLRLETWKNDEQARAGIGVCCDPETGYGLNLAFHRGQLKFVHDYVAWAPGCEFSYQTGTWYWMKLSKTADALRGKAWRDGEAEPADWMVSWKQFDQSLTGFPALLGSSGGPEAASTVSFAECRVVRTGPGPMPSFAKKATWQETLAASLELLAQQDAAAAKTARPASDAPRGKALAATGARVSGAAVAASNGVGTAGWYLAKRWLERDGYRAGGTLCCGHSHRDG